MIHIIICHICLCLYTQRTLDMRGNTVALPREEASASPETVCFVTVVYILAMCTLGIQVRARHLFAS